MEQENRSLITIFVVIMIVSFMISFLRSFPLLLFNPSVFDINNIQNAQFYTSIISLINLIINPFLVFIGFYNIGKRFDLRSNLKSVIIRLLIGAYLGQFFSIIIVYLIRWSDFYQLLFISSIISVSFLGPTFSSFTALAIAYLKQKD